MIYPSYYPSQNAYGGAYLPQAVNNPQNAQNSGYGANSGIIWVQGEAGAKSYLVAPNSTVQLWDSESQTIYLKSADASGMPSMKIIDYTIREQTTAQTTPASSNSAYVTREEMEQVRKEIAAIMERLQKEAGNE